KVECFQTDKFIAFFKTDSDFSFDLFAAIFYLLVRYEEYLPYEKDRYGRFAHDNSIAFKEGFLQTPVINIWLEELRNVLAKRNPEFATSKNTFSFLPTYDIDIAWSYLNKGLKRNAGAIIQLFATGKWKSLANRIKVLKGKLEDPFDAYEWMDELHMKYKLQPIYFFLVARGIGRYDKNINIDNIPFRQLIHAISTKYIIGLHPSWASNDMPSLLTEEKHSLEQIVTRPITNTRQHYIRFQPVTFQRLLALGLTHDYSMGYGSINGFRASITSSYKWYNLKNESATSLTMHPYCFMDANSYYEQHLTPSEALDELKMFNSIIRPVNGTMITIWHNNFLGTDDEFKGWREAYEEFIKSSIVNNL
ncbi:MAG: polysaccharide deacetylase family protein, partial [Flavisolibacter sp.]